jgi:hypothetical protein
MIDKSIACEVYGVMSEFDIRFYTDEDLPRIHRKFEVWKTLHTLCKEDGDRAPNMPESISEVIYCMITHTTGRYMSAKKLANRSFDAFDFLNKETIQIKAGQIKNDCTSFGPKSKWDKLVFMDFYNGGNIDGTVDIYDIPTDLVHKVIVCEYDKETGEKNITFLRQQELQRRPRFCMKESIIVPNSIEPVYKKVKLW